MPFPVAIAKTFWDSFTRQPRGVQRKIQDFLDDFIAHGAEHPSFKYKDMEGDVDSRIREARVDRTYRVIMLHPKKGEPFRVLWVDHHDEALAWPKGRRILCDGQAVHVVGGGLHETSPGKPKTKGVFAHWTRDELMAAGLSSFLVQAVRALDTPDDLELLLKELEPGLSDRLQTMFAYDTLEEARRHFGEKPAPPAVVVETDGPILHDSDALSQTIDALRALSPTQLHELLKSPLWSGVVRLASGLPRTRRLETVVLDRAQQRFAQSIDDGPRLLKGVAGSGKTLILVSLAMFKAMQGVPRILITCFNLALTRYVNSLLDANLSNPLHRGRVEVLSIFELCGRVLGREVRHEGEQQPYYDGLVSAAYRAARQADGLYDAVLVDEAQDLSVDMLKLVVAVAKSKDVKIAEDMNQNLFDRRPPGFSWKSVGVSMRGRTTILRTSHRSTHQIADAADRLAGAQLSRCIEDENGQQLLLQREDRSGPEVDERSFDSPRELADHALGAIRKLLDDGVPAGEIAIIYTRTLHSTDGTGIPYECLELIERGLGSDLVRLVATSADKLGLDVLENTIKMGSVYAFKGLDFEAVLLLDGLGAKAGKGTVLFVGATRAREHLHVLTLR